MADAKTKVTLIQSPDGQVRRARIDGTEVAVLNARPTIVNGKIAVSLTIGDVDLDAEQAAPASAVDGLASRVVASEQQIAATAAITGGSFGTRS